jgi:hypothetical protein
MIHVISEDVKYNALSGNTASWGARSMSSCRLQGQVRFGGGGSSVHSGIQGQSGTGLGVYGGEADARMTSGRCRTSLKD